MRSINVLNILLFAMLVALAAYILPPLAHLNASYTVPPPKKMAEEKEEPAPAGQAPAMTEYTVIAEQNLFHPERKIVAENKDEKPLPKPEFVLYGTLIDGDTKIAFIEDLKAPYTTASRGKRQRTLRLGEPLSGFTLREVLPDRVVMVRGEERVELSVIDASHAKTRETATTVAPQQQVPAGRAGGSAAAPQQPPGAAPGVVRGPRPQTPPQTPPQKEFLFKSAPRFERPQPSTPQTGTPQANPPTTQ